MRRRKADIFCDTLGGISLRRKLEKEKEKEKERERTLIPNSHLHNVLYDRFQLNFTTVEYYWQSSSSHEKRLLLRLFASSSSRTTPAVPVYLPLTSYSSWIYCFVYYCPVGLLCIVNKRDSLLQKCARYEYYTYTLW